MPAPEQGPDKPLGWLTLGAIAIFGTALAIGMSNEPTSPSDDELLETPVENSIEPEQPATPIPLDQSAVERGQAQMKLVAHLDLAEASRTFSQNCYDALAKKFDWHQLDRCGSFDALARRWAEANFKASDDELSWFQSETAATRYLTAATSNGLPASEADIRWAEIELSSARQSLPQAAMAQVAEEMPMDTLSDDADPLASDQVPAAELEPGNRLD